MTTVKLRDFIYLDVERVKSIYAQIEEGLLVERSEARGSEKEGEAGGEVSLPFLASLSSKGRFVWTNEATETRTLHDHMYNHIERKLLEKGLIVQVHAESASQVMREGRSGLSPIAFLLVKGQVLLNDYRYLEALLKDFNQIVKFITQSAAESAAKLLPEKDRRKAMAAAGGQGQLPKEQVEGIIKIIQTFYGDRIILRVLPNPSEPNIRVVGNLILQHLRDSPRDIVFKYSTTPRDQRTVFGQIATIPLEEHKPFAFEAAFGTEMEKALEVVFRALREIDAVVGTSVAYPEISITPIAVYRE